MIIFFIYYVFWFFCVVSGSISATNHLPVNSHHPRSCDDTTHTALVEKFFNYVFTEFHDSPPACICVQMCERHYMYCFPNACMKHKEYKDGDDTTANKVVKDEVKMIDNHHSPAKETKSNPFLDFYDDIKMSDLVSSHSHSTPTTPMAHHQYIENFHTDLFKEHYKTVFKYSKIPKIQLRYNLKEQVKHRNKFANSVVDATKTLWPYNLHKKSSQITFEIMKPNIMLHKSQSLRNRHLPLYESDDTNYVKRDVSKITEDSANETKISLKIDDPISENKTFLIEYSTVDELLDNEVVNKNKSRKRNGIVFKEMIKIPHLNMTSDIRKNSKNPEKRSLKYFDTHNQNLNISSHESKPRNEVNGTLISALDATTEFHPEISRFQNMVGFVIRPGLAAREIDTQIKKRFSRNRSMLETKKRHQLPPRRKRTKPFV